MKLNNELKKILLIAISSICFVSGFFTTSKAVEAFTTELIASSTTVEMGDEITIGIIVNNINVGNGIQAIQGKLIYDTEKLTYINVVGSNGWGAPIYNPENGMIVVESSNYVTKEQEVMKITFKVNEHIELGETQIQFSEVQASDGEIMTNGTESLITINVTELQPDDDADITDPQPDDDADITDPQPDDDTDGTEDNNQTNTNEKENNDTEQSENNQKPSQDDTAINENKDDQATTDNRLPQTGQNSIIIVVAMVLIIAVIISYIKYKKYKGIK